MWLQYFVTALGHNSIALYNRVSPNIRYVSNRINNIDIILKNNIISKNTGLASTNQYVVGIGSSFWQKGQKHKVDKIFKHVGFSFNEFRSDVALLKLSTPIALKKGRITPICLPPKNSEVLGAGTIAGWGITANENTKPSEALMRVNVEILEDKVCALQYPNYNHNEMICAGKLAGGIGK